MGGVGGLKDTWQNLCAWARLKRPMCAAALSEEPSALLPAATKPRSQEHLGSAAWKQREDLH